MKIKNKILSETSEEVKQRVRDTANKLVMKKETLEEAAERLYLIGYESKSKDIINFIKQDAFKQGAKWQQERSYSEREIYVLIHERDAFWKRYKSTDSQDYISAKKWFKQFKKK